MSNPKEKRSRKVTTSPVAETADPFATPPTASEEYQSFVGLLSAFSHATTRLASMQQSLDEVHLATVEGIRTDYASLQEQLGSLIEKLETMARANPAWFGKGKQLKTPFGVVKLTAATRLEVPNEELTIALLEERRVPAAARFLRTRTELNLEAMEALDDAELKTLRVRRITEDKFKVTPARVDLGHAVAAATARKEGK